MTTATVIAPTEERRQTTHRRAHAHCFACGESVGGGLGLHFRVLPDGGVAADWSGAPAYCSYDGILHGGLIATLLDSAMVHALFARSVAAYTAELRVRFHHPVRPSEPVAVTARVSTHLGPLYCLEATVGQKGVVCATAHAKFMATSVNPEVAAPPETQINSPRMEPTACVSMVATASHKLRR